MLEDWDFKLTRTHKDSYNPKEPLSWKKILQAYVQVSFKTSRVEDALGYTRLVVELIQTYETYCERKSLPTMASEVPEALTQLVQHFKDTHDFTEKHDAMITAMTFMAL